MGRRDWIAIFVLLLMLGQALVERDGEVTPRGRIPPAEPPRMERPWDAPGYQPGLADGLPTVEREGRIVLEARRLGAVSTGSAFPVDGNGLMLTAYHVVQGCDTVLLEEQDGGFRAIAVVGVHPNADVALVDGGRGATPLPLADAVPPISSPGFHYGYPAGEPGAAASLLLGRSAIRTSGVRDTREPVLVWARAAQWPEGLTSLGGASGGPTLDRSGAVVGVTIAEDPRRGRIYSAAPESLAAARPDGAVPSALTAPIGEANWLQVERQLRGEGKVRRILCAAGQRFRLGDTVRLMAR